MKHCQLKKSLDPNVHTTYTVVQYEYIHQVAMTGPQNYGLFYFRFINPDLEGYIKVLARRLIIHITFCD